MRELNMNEWIRELQGQKDQITQICDKIENGQAYMAELRSFLPEMNQMITGILNLAGDPNVALDLNTEFVIQVLKDIIYGIENEDSVFLLDVLRYGLQEIYEYIETEVGGGAADE